jgi:hypothetical protein
MACPERIHACTQRGDDGVPWLPEPPVPSRGRRKPQEAYHRNGQEVRVHRGTGAPSATGRTTWPACSPNSPRCLSTASRLTSGSDARRRPRELHHSWLPRGWRETRHSGTDAGSWGASRVTRGDRASEGRAYGLPGIDADEAFGLLRRQSQHRNVKLREVAHDVVAPTQSFLQRQRSGVQGLDQHQVHGPESDNVQVGQVG